PNKMMKTTTLAVLALVLTASCVSPKVYKDLEAKYADLKSENRKLSDENEALLNAKTAAENELKQLKSAYDEAVVQRDKLQSDYDATKANYDALKASYDALEKNSSAAIAANSQKNRELLARSEEHTSELQSRENLVCRLLLEKKNKKKNTHTQL